MENYVKRQTRELPQVLSGYIIWRNLWQSLEPSKPNALRLTSAALLAAGYQELDWVDCEGGQVLCIAWHRDLRSSSDRKSVV